ncbi:MAG: triose-phosphate isomerase [Pseudomonadota bacterium]
MTRRMLAAGNWKMNGLGASISELGGLIAANRDAKAEILICPPATLMAAMAELSREHNITIGAQDCHPAPNGAHTGDLSAEMIADAGGSYVIVGHSERRADHGEDDALVRSKAEAAWRADLTAIICVGETEAQRDAGNALGVVADQLEGSVPNGASAGSLVIAYEPVWAIGTGRTPSLDDIAEMHDAIRAQMVTRFGDQIGNGIRLLYGGSVKPGNAAEIFAIENVDGGLVGGASLKAADFTGIIAAASV